MTSGAYVNMQPTLTIPTCAQQDAQLIFAGEYDMPLVDPPKVVLDIGANVGLFSAWAAQEWPEAIIHAYEPHPENADMFSKNLDRLEHRVKLHRNGVRNASGVSKFHANTNRMRGGFKEEIGESFDVESISGEQLPAADFVKIDAEGSECEIIGSMDLSSVKAIVLESHAEHNTKSIEWFLKEAGFEIYRKTPNRHEGHCVLKFARPGVIRKETKGAFIAIPYYGGHSAMFTNCLLSLIQNPPPFSIALKHLEGDSLVSRARNTLTAEFLKSDYTDLIFIDSDLVFSSEQIERIMSHDVDVVAGFYPKKQDGNLRWVTNGLAGAKPDPITGLQEVRYMGTGFLRIRRRVLEQMIEKYASLTAFTPDHAPGTIQHDLWPVGVYQYEDGTRRYLSEDWFFCQRWLDMGGKVYGDTGIVLRHVGTAVYPLLHQIPQITNPIESLVENASDHAK